MAYNFYRNNTDVSLRQEFEDLLLGKDTSSPTGVPYLVRALRIDPVTKVPIPCDCVDPVTKEPDRDTPCPICGGSGFLYDEKIMYGWKFDKTSLSIDPEASPVGLLPDGTYVFYFRAHEIIDRIDGLYDIRLDQDGRVFTPIERIQEYTIVRVNRIRLDNSRVEFVKVMAKLRDGFNLNSRREIYG